MAWQYLLQWAAVSWKQPEDVQEEAFPRESMEQPEPEDVQEAAVPRESMEQPEFEDVQEEAVPRESMEQPEPGGGSANRGCAGDGSEYGAA